MGYYIFFPILIVDIYKVRKLTEHFTVVLKFQVKFKAEPIFSQNQYVVAISN